MGAQDKLSLIGAPQMAESEKVFFFEPVIFNLNYLSMVALFLETEKDDLPPNITCSKMPFIYIESYQEQLISVLCAFIITMQSLKTRVHLSDPKDRNSSK
jgi:hypothetical protein